MASRDLGERRLAVDATALAVPDETHLLETGRAELTLELVGRREPGAVDRLEARKVTVQPEIREVRRVEGDDARAAAGREQPPRRAKGSVSIEEVDDQPVDDAVEP